MASTDIVFRNFKYVYIWIDAAGKFRSKTRNIVSHTETSHPLAPRWNYDGSSTGQAPTDESEIELVPIATYKSPSVVYVLCSTFKQNGHPTFENTHHMLTPAIQSWMIENGVRIAFEQEFFIYDIRTGKPLRYDDWKTKRQGEFYCSVGAGGNGFIEPYVQEVFERGLELGLRLTGYNLEVAPAQGEIQVDGPAVRAAHDLTMLRYLLWDILGKHGLYPVFDPKPLGPEWNGSGLHTNVSTLQTISVEDGGMRKIIRILKHLESKHRIWIPALGVGNERRLTGIHETSSLERFTWGVGSRTTSIRIPNSTHAAGAGYFEDRRPAANADPYTIVWLYAQALLEVENSVY
jgi:glutamine synthetase